MIRYKGSFHIVWPRCVCFYLCPLVGLYHNTISWVLIGQLLYRCIYFSQIMASKLIMSLATILYYNIACAIYTNGFELMVGSCIE